MLILIAEDTDDSRVMLEMALTAQGYRVMSAKNGIEALELARQTTPDLIISDIMMPEMDGFELCRQAKANPDLKTTPFIFYTATYTERQDEELAMALGAVRFIIKPTQPKAFMQIIQEVLNDSRSEALGPSEEPPRDDKELNHMYTESVGRKLDKKLRELETERAALKASEEKYRALVESVQDHYFFYAHDANGMFTYLSPSIELILGYKPEDYLNHYTESLTDNPVNDRVKQYTELALRGEEQAPYEAEIYHKNGSRRWMEVKEHPILDSSGNITTIEGIAYDITERKEAEKLLERLNRALRTLSATNETLVHATEEQQLLNDICDIIVEVGKYPQVWVGFVERKDSLQVNPVAKAGTEGGFIESLPDRYFACDGDNPESCPALMGVHSEGPVVITHLRTDPRHASWHEIAAKYDIGAMISLPLQFGAEGLGVLSIYAAEADAFHEDEIALLQELSDDLSFGIETLLMRSEHEQSAVKLQNALVQAIQAIANTVEMRDPYTAGHQRRTADLAVAIGKEMGLDESQLEGILLGAMIHDIGKINIPAEILSRPGKISAEEFALIKFHPMVGFDIVKGVEFPWPVDRMISQHHERLDGSGYPRGLKDSEIILEARILAVADTVEAMASHRPYRPGLGIETALDEIKKNSGRLYDPEVANACIRLFEQQDYELEIAPHL